MVRKTSDVIDIVSHLRLLHTDNNNYRWSSTCVSQLNTLSLQTIIDAIYVIFIHINLQGLTKVGCHNGGATVVDDRY